MQLPRSDNQGATEANGVGSLVGVHHWDGGSGTALAERISGGREPTWGWRRTRPQVARSRSPLPLEVGFNPSHASADCAILTQRLHRSASCLAAMNSTVDQSPSLSSLGAWVAIDPSIHQPADQKALRRKVYRNASDSLIVRGTF